MVEEAAENSDLEDVVDNSEIRAYLVDDFLISTEGQTTGSVPRSRKANWIPFDCALTEARPNQAQIESHKESSPSKVSPQKKVESRRTRVTKKATNVASDSKSKQKTSGKAPIKSTDQKLLAGRVTAPKCKPMTPGGVKHVTGNNKATVSIAVQKKPSEARKTVKTKKKPNGVLNILCCFRRPH